MICPCAACRADPDDPPPRVPPSERYLDEFNARTRAILGLPALPVLTDLPADVRRFVELAL